MFAYSTAANKFLTLIKNEQKMHKINQIFGILFIFIGFNIAFNISN